MVAFERNGQKGPIGVNAIRNLVFPRGAGGSPSGDIDCAHDDRRCCRAPTCSRHRNGVVVGSDDNNRIVAIEHEIDSLDQAPAILI